MFACHLCSKFFEKKAGLTQHCKGKKHLENISAPEKRKEIDALESAVLAQRQKLSSDAAALESAALAQRQSDAAALESAALAQRKKMSSDAASVRGGFAEEVKSPFHESTLKNNPNPNPNHFASRL